MNAAELDPGIRSVVLWLCEHGFETTDSGDGVSKPEGQIEIDFPHVFMVVEPSLMIGEAQRLRALVQDAGLLAAAPALSIEATYTPLDGVATLALFGVDEAALADFAHGSEP